ncbi:MEDS domain-containing protein [Streptomyces sp. VNUA116]|uniref:MEDS domain-containing protein n=1 Tax=Streptomyces sp. VNUA116 TaxID=3062449 RepID=UPI002675A64D|nr:MEDS domain-containing protein [Streptomyces sp. VNUA116]WKU47214.1 MEDS domain-containing protein [Streptomyces sp. VNUA116]
MAADRTGSTGFVHHACLYGSDAEFLAMAVPFVRDGLAAGEPVLAATTPANIELLREALGESAHHLDTAETAHFGRRPVDRVAAFLRYHERRARPGRRTRMIAEPVWAGRSARQTAEWKRMEAGLNVLLAGLPVWMVCPYDTRVVPGDVVEAAVATHPVRLDGERQAPCASYTDPAAYAAALEVPAAASCAPPSAARTGPTDDAAVLRLLARERAAGAGLTGARLALAELAVHEAAAYLLTPEDARVTLRAWEEPGAVVYELRRTERDGGGVGRGARGERERTGPGGGLTVPDAAVPPFAGYRPPAPAGDAHGAEDGLWLARCLGDSLEVRARGPETVLTLRVAGQGDAERL